MIFPAVLGIGLAILWWLIIVGITKGQAGMRKTRKGRR